MALHILTTTRKSHDKALRSTSSIRAHQRYLLILLLALARTKRTSRSTDVRAGTAASLAERQGLRLRDDVHVVV